MTELGPYQLLAFFVAATVAMTVGAAISSARNAAAGQLFSVCQGTDSAIIAAMSCGTGVLVLLMLTGVIGVFLLVFRALS